MHMLLLLFAKFATVTTFGQSTAVPALGVLFIFQLLHSNDEQIK